MSKALLVLLTCAVLTCSATGAEAPARAAGVDAEVVAQASAGVDAKVDGKADAADAAVGSGPQAKLASPPEGADAWARACSTRHRLCVRASPGTAPATAVAALEAADRMWDVLVHGIGLPPPIGPDEERWELYLVEHVQGGSSDALLSGREPMPSFDRGSSFGVVDRLTPLGCPLESSIAYAVARGALWRSVPATDQGSARGEAQMLATLVNACAGGDDDVRVFQSTPARCIVDPSSAAFGRGASLFFEWLDETFGTRPGALILGLAALSPTITRPASWRAGRWSDTPTPFDVLRVSLHDARWKGSTIEDIFVEFAIARALTLNAPRPPLAWHVPWPTQPRRLAAPVAVAPTGASYVVVDCAGSPRGARLRLEMEWEDYARMRWVAIKLDAAGRVVAQLPVGSLDRATHAAMTIATLDGVDHVLVVGVNTGDTERGFNPDDQQWEPHGWLLTVAAE